MASQTQTNAELSANPNDLMKMDGQTSSQANLELWKAVDEEKEKLFSLMEQVNVRLNKKSQGEHVTLDLRHCHWEEVMEEVQTIARSRESCSSKLSKTMRCINRVGRHSSAFQSWLGLLPAGDYGSSICGAFKLVVGAAASFARVEETILDVLSDIPEALEDARDYIRIYADQRDTVLEQRTFDLFRVILRTLTHVMQFYADSPARKLWEPMIKQSSYKRDLALNLDEVKKNVTRIKVEADKCLARRVFEQGSRISDTQEKSEEGLMILKSIRDHLLNGDKVEHTQPLIEGLTMKPNGKYSVLLEKSTRDGPGDRRGREDGRRLLRLLRFDADLPSRDTATCMRLGQLLDERAKTRAAALACSPKFIDRLTGTSTSTTVLVNGHEDLGSADGLSPLTLISAKLATLAEATGFIFVVKYFADQHRPSLDRDVISSSVGMMASLVCQLLNQMVARGIPVNLAFLTKVDWQHVEKLNLSILCIIFRELTNQLRPQSILFCILDELSLYETTALAQDTDAVIRRLTRLTLNHDTITFKLLVTCRGRALRISKYFFGNVIDLEEDPELDDIATWKIAAMKGLAL